MARAARDLTDVSTPRLVEMLLRELSQRNGGELTMDDIRKIPATSWEDFADLLEELDGRDDFDDHLHLLTFAMQKGY